MHLSSAVIFTGLNEFYDLIMSREQTEGVYLSSSSVTVLGLVQPQINSRH